MAAAMYDNAAPASRPGARLAELEEVVLIVPQLCLGILGALAMTSEYANGLIKTSFVLVPRRWPVMAAKATLVGTIGLVTGPAVVFGTYFTCRAVVGDRFSGLYQVPFTDKVPLLIAFSLTVPVFALLGLGLGAILRSTASAIVLLASLIYVIPITIGNLPQPWNDQLGSVMIGALTREITGDMITSSVYGELLPPCAAAAVLLGYAVLPILVGAWLVRRRDV